MPEIPELSPAEFADRWPDGPVSDDVVLLDVREPDEISLAALEGAVWIPMNQVPRRLHELERACPTVVMCHGGSRSRRVAEYLAAQGFSQVFNLAGGIDAWSQEVDAAVPRY